MATARSPIPPRHRAQPSRAGGCGGPFLPPPPPLDLPALNALRPPNHKRIVLASASPRRRQLLGLLGLPRIVVVPSGAPEDVPRAGLAPWEYVLATAERKARAVYEREVQRADARAAGGSGRRQASKSTKQKADADTEALIGTNPESGAGAAAADGDGDSDDDDREFALVLAADTVVADTSAAGGGAILEKPRSEASHIAMLTRLRAAGSAHKVYTAVVAMAPRASAREPGYALESAVEETTVVFDHAVTDDLIRAYVRTREGVDKAGGYAVQGLGTILIQRIEGSWDNVVGLPLRETLKVIGKALAKADDDDMYGDEDLLGLDSEEEGE